MELHKFISKRLVEKLGIPKSGESQFQVTLGDVYRVGGKRICKNEVVNL